MSEDTKFPFLKMSFDLSNINPSFGESAKLVFNPSDPQRDWFKRCLEDYPELDRDKLFSEMFMLHGVRVDTGWFEKWFSQFKETPS